MIISIYILTKAGLLTLYMQTASPAASPSVICLEGEILQVPYSNERAWHVLLVRTLDGRVVRATGTLERPVVGTRVNLSGRYTDDGRNGFVIDSSVGAVEQPTAAIVGHLVQVLGIDAVTAGRIAGQFGPRTLEVLDTAPERLSEVPNLHEPTELAERWRKRRIVERSGPSLRAQGLSLAATERLTRALGGDPTSAIQRNPYLPVLLFEDTNFDSYDRQLRRSGIDLHNAAWVSGAIMAALRRRKLGGHTFIERAALGSYLSKELGIKKMLEPALIDEAIGLCVEAGVVREFSGRLALKALADAELLTVERLSRIATGANELRPPSAERLGVLAQSLYSEPLPPAQAVKFEHFLKQKIGCLHGPAAAHMTRLPIFLAHAWQLLQAQVVLVVPTPAVLMQYRNHGLLEGTVQSLDTVLGRSIDGSCAFHAEHPLPHEVVIVAEADRLTLPDFAALVAAVPNHASLYLIGDTVRIPPTGPGQPFADLIVTRWAHSLPLPDTTLFVPTTARPLVTQLRLLLKGRPPAPVDAEDPSAPLLFFPLSSEEARDIENTLLVLGREVLPSLVPNFDPVRDLLVLSPNRKDMPGVPSLPKLNRWLSEVFRPGVTRVALPPTTGEQYGAGDPVFVRRTDEAIGLRFGERGVVEAVDAPAQELAVRFPGGGSLRVPFARATGLTLGYATTAYQASGFRPRCVVALMLNGHLRMLSLELLYTSLASASERTILLAEPEALEKALANESGSLRDCMLTEYLKALPVNTLPESAA